MTKRTTEREQKAPLGVINQRFKVIGALGHGATSTVFEVEDLQVANFRAMKLLHPDGDEDLMHIEFARLSRLDHPRLVRVYDLDRIQHYDPGPGADPLKLAMGRLFLILDLVRGADPVTTIANQSLEQREALLFQMAQDLAGALAHIHGHGLVHHDLKPENILVDAENHVQLIDLGLATWAHQQITGRGTLAYLAPEALIGGGDFRTDLYGLGATLFHLASGRPPFSSKGTRLFQEILDHSPRLEVPWLSEEFTALIHRLLRKNPLQRPSSARAILAELARIRGDHHAVAELSSGQELLAPPMVGRGHALEQLTRAFASTDTGGPPALVLVIGGPGMGKTRLVQEAIRSHRIQAAAGRAPARDFASGSLKDLLQGRIVSAPVTRWIQGTAPGVNEDELVLQMADALGEVRSVARVLHFNSLEEDPFTRRVLEVLQRGSLGDGSLMLIVEVSPRDAALGAGEEVLRLEIAPLSQAEVDRLVAAILGRPADPDLVRRIYTLSSGSPLITAELTRQWYHLGEAGLDLKLVTNLDPLIMQTFRWLDPRLVRILEAMAVWEQRISAAQLSQLLARGESEILADLTELEARGLLDLATGRSQFPTTAHLQAWQRVLNLNQSSDPEQLRALHLRSATLLRAQDVHDLPRLAKHLIGAHAPDAVQVALAAGQELADTPGMSSALIFLEYVLREGDLALSTIALPLVAELYIQAGRYDEAIALVKKEEGSLGVIHARALARKGDTQAAETLLKRILPLLEPGDQRNRAMALLGRLLLQQGKFKAAIELSEEAVDLIVAEEPAVAAEGGIALLEMCGLAHLYLGNLDWADRLFARGEEVLRTSEMQSQRAHFASLRGMTALNAGQPREAAGHYQKALDFDRLAGDLHGKATYQANLGAALMDLGHLAQSLATLTQAVDNLERLSKTTDLAPALCNLTNLLLFLGDFRQAQRVLRQAQALVSTASDNQTLGFTHMLEGDIQRRSGALRDAERSYQLALSTFAKLGSSREHMLCQLALADIFTQQGRREDARRLLEGLPEISDLDGPLSLSWARLLLASDGSLASSFDLAAHLAAYCARLEGAGADKDFWRAAAMMGRVLLREKSQKAARTVFERAIHTWEELVKRTPEIYHEPMKKDPDVSALLSTWRSMLDEGIPEDTDRGSSGPAPDEVRRIKRLLAINKRLNSELRLPRLLEMIMDTVIELTDADRGFLLLADQDGILSIQIARNIDHQSLAGDELALSRSIAEQSARTGEPVITFDAAADGRFQEAMSVSVLHLRSVLAVPLQVKGRTVGTVYIDSRSKMGLFGAAAVQLVQDVADQAAIAIDNARLLADNQAKTRDIEELNLQLQQKVERQEAELQEAREELRSNRQALQVRYDYRNIIGRTTKMMELFHLLDRVTDTALPVVVQGDSGTGKELVARAIHQNGPRCSGPFISENCAAIPETLLESVLFGHVRGAFTGADRDRKGLFEVASGGTLFLDEVGEMSPAMQTKLLRVLQNGEYRRVGGNQTHQTDVRVITASNKNLRDLVEQGQFREDLFYRLNVILIQIPALKDRREDIPLLVQHFVEKHGAGKKIEISSRAMALLMGNSWPGNVRELENEIMRATALGGEVIQPEDLSPQLNKSIPLAMGPGDDFELKARVEHLERELIVQALAKTTGNHTHAAKTLGLSRYGLLKKIKRYGIDEGK